jgi:hypothetical protein
MAIRKKVKKKPANTVQLSNRKPQDVNAIENLKGLAKALPACSDITAALRWLCEVEAPKAAKRFLVAGG